MRIIAHDNYGIILRKTKCQILLLTQDNSWTLPKFSHTEASDINAEIKEKLDISVVLLDCVYDKYKEQENGEQQKIYLMECRDWDQQPPPDGRWVSRKDLQEVVLAVPEHLAAIEACLFELETGNIPSQRVPWARVGWLDEASDWIEQQLSFLGYMKLGPIEQVIARRWSSILRVTTSAGRVYFKAASPIFSHESSLTASLANLYSNNIPTILATNDKHGWMLMKDMGQNLAETLWEKRNNAHYDKFISLFSQLQIDAINYIGLFEDCGCPNLRLDKFPTLFNALLADESALLLEQEKGLAKKELAFFRDFEPRLRDICEELASYSIPETLHHDDFYVGNVSLNKQNYIFFDWAECGIAHPFLSLFTFFKYARLTSGVDQEVLFHWRNVYLEPWTQYGSKEQLIKAFQLAQKLGILCRAFTWHKVVSNLEKERLYEYETALVKALREFRNAIADHV